jgi:UDP-N-acetylglucosamine--N-acetylmuramyl-(pentapeptide) pyrophosphoryl-undecaprenol N-acetylglucosamine transferase
MGSRANPLTAGPITRATHFAASAGGHLDLLLRLQHEAVPGAEPVWVTSRTARGAKLAEDRPRVRLLPEFGRSPLRVLANLRAALRIVIRERPRLVVTSGAGVVAPFCALARLGGARLVFVETMARVRGPSMTARLLTPLADTVIVQWPELREALPRATVCRPTLLDDIARVPHRPGLGTFVAVGTHGEPYERLLSMVERAAGAGVLPRPIVAQTGAADWQPPGVDGRRWMSRGDVEKAVREAEVVVCHGGAGILSSALAAGRRPLVLPRRARLGEHVDDHQEELAGKLAERRLAVVLGDAITPADVERAREPIGDAADAGPQPSAAAVLREALAG